MSEEPFALVLDDEEATLGGVALRLVRSGVAVLHAKGIEEARLLGEQERDRIRALLFPPGLDLDHVATLVAQLERKTQERPLSLVVVGERPGDESCERLRQAGVDWAIWETENDASLRFAVNTALALPREVAPRKERRAAVALTVPIRAGDERKDAVLYVLSARGAYLEVAPAPAEGATLNLELPLPDGPVETEARVIYRNPSDARRTRALPAGVGIVFTDLDVDAEERLRRFVEAEARFSI